MGTLRVEAGNPAPSASGPGGQTSAFAYISWTMIRYTTMVRQSGATPISGVEEGADAILKLALSPDWKARAGSISMVSARRAPMRSLRCRRGPKLTANTIKLAGLSARERASS